MTAMLKCDACGRYARREPGASWAMRYEGSPPQPHGQDFRCLDCTMKRGPLAASRGMRTETAGLVGEDRHG